MSILSQVIGGGNSSPITGYTQTATLLTSQSIAIPYGTKRIEALLCGAGSGYGFGGLQIYEIPITGSTLNLVVGAGTNTLIGGETSISANGVKVAAVGGYFAAGGLFGMPPFSVKNLLWSMLDHAPKSGLQPGTIALGNPGVTDGLIITPGSQANTSQPGTDGANGYGGSCGSAGSLGSSGKSGGSGAAGGFGAADGSGFGQGYNGGVGGVGAGAGAGAAGTDNWWNGATYLSGGSGAGNTGGSLSSVTVWGLTGFAGGLGGTGYTYGSASGTNYGAGGGGGGGGMLGAGSNGANGNNTVNGVGGNGGNGGGGGGGSRSTRGTGGNGFALLRFYS